MLIANYTKYNLNFKLPAGTSRGVLNNKETFFIKIFNSNNPNVFGIGECAVFNGLSFDDKPNFEHQLNYVCNYINDISISSQLLYNWPAIKFGLETALLDLHNGGKQIIYKSDFTLGNCGIEINGLVWMGDPDFINKQVADKLQAGYQCLKFKIGALNIDNELEILHNLRKKYLPHQLEIRLDANGAFSYPDVLYVLKNFSKYNIHSIEQPIKAGNIDAMHEICQASPIAIALDEELIGILDYEAQSNLLKQIKPKYIILKPALIGGFTACNQWIALAEKHNIGWWVTSSLESNIGLNAIAQYTATLNVTMPQGLGTGGLFTNNIESPLYIKANALYMNNKLAWNLQNISQHA